MNNTLKHNIKIAVGNWGYLKNPEQWKVQTMQDYKNNINKFSNYVFNHPLFDVIFKEESEKTFDNIDDFDILQKKVWKILNQIQKLKDIEGDFKK